MDPIRRLNTRQQCREKLPIFFGSRDNYTHGFREIIANSCDEITNNFETGKILVLLHDDGKTITVQDSGRGIPINHTTDGVPNYELLFQTLFAGTNYDNIELDKTTTGTNGCGTCVLNHTSKIFIVEVAREGKRFKVTYENGGQFKGLEDLGEFNGHYTKVTYELDEEIYTKTTYDFEQLKEIVKATAGVTNNIEFAVKHKEEIQKYNYSSVVEYFNDIVSGLTGNTIRTCQDIDNENMQHIEVILNTSTKPTQQSFLNRTHLVDGGTINEGVIAGVRQFMSKLLRDNKKYQKTAKAISMEDVRGSISFVIDCLSTSPEFSNQTKFSTAKTEYKTLVQRITFNLLSNLYESKPKALENFINHILTVAKFNEDSGKSKAKLQKKLNESIEKPDTRVARLVDSKYHGSSSELYITEGLSALGSVVLARDAEYQACYPLSGKILNCLKADFEQIFKNDIITDLIKVLGCGTVYKDLFNLDNLRFGKIIIATDQDSDGYDIQTLALTVFYRLMPQLITEGYVYIANTPLYEVRLNDDTMLYWYSEEERKSKIAKYDNIKLISRAKGLGELTAEVMAETAMNPNTRRLTQVTVDMLNYNRVKDIFELWMGDEAEPRREYIEENLDKVYESEDTQIPEQLLVNTLLTDAKMEYSKYIIKERFLCDYRDGLKPVHRRILWAMKQSKATNLTKCNTISGNVMAYHPHGDCYDTMVNLIQPDKQLVPLIIGKGNFGQNTSRDIQYAASRYTECKLSDIAKDMLDNITSTVKMVPNYDNTKMLPEVLPVKFPAILTYANSGIGVGMSSSSASFNLSELCGVIVNYLQTNKKLALIPDFATGGYIIYEPQVIQDINLQGYGSLTLRAKCEIKDNIITVKEIPYGKTREAIIERIVKLIEQSKLDDILMVKDLTGLKGVNIEITVRKSKRSQMNEILQKLYTLTPLQSTYSVNMRMLVDDLPIVLGVWDTIERWLDWRRDCITKELQHELSIAKEKQNVLEGFVKIIEVLDELINCIRNSNESQVIRNLMKTFNLNKEQAEYIGEMKLRNINKEYLKNRVKELGNLEKRIEQIVETLNSSKKIDEIIIKNLQDIDKKFGIPRRTLIIR